MFVDDLSAECTAPNKVIRKELGGFIEQVAEEIEAHGMELSKKKSIFTANSKLLRTWLKKRWEKYGIKPKLCAKSLGAAVAAGCRRNTMVMKQRLRDFKARLPRFQKLRRMKVNPARVIRTGGKAAVVYGQAVTGVSNSFLEAQRRAVAAAVAPSNGTGG